MKIRPGFFLARAFVALSFPLLGGVSAASQPDLSDPRFWPPFQVAGANRDLSPYTGLDRDGWIACGPAERGLALGFGVEPTWFSRSLLARVLDGSANRKSGLPSAVDRHRTAAANGPGCGSCRSPSRPTKRSLAIVHGSVSSLPGRRVVSPRRSPVWPKTPTLHQSVTDRSTAKAGANESLRFRRNP